MRDTVEMRLAVLLVSFGILLHDGRAAAGAEPRPSLRPRPVAIYTNQFAVHVPDGDDAAADIAERHGFQNLGQVSEITFKNSFLLSLFR